MVRQSETLSRIRPDGDNGYFEELTKAIFRSGFNWRVVHEKWPAFQQAFDGFNLETVAFYGQEDIDRLSNDRSIVRNRRKILGTIDNARRTLELVEEHGSFLRYLRSLDGLDYHETVAALTGQFVGLGRTGAFVFLRCVDEETPDWQDR